MGLVVQRVRVLCPGIDPDSLTSEAEARNVLKRHATDELGFLQVRGSCCSCYCCLSSLDTTGASLLRPSVLAVHVVGVLGPVPVVCWHCSCM